MRTTLSPRWAANELERLVVHLTADDLEQLVWDGALEQSYPLGHTVRIEVGDSEGEEEPLGELAPSEAPAHGAVSGQG